MSETDVAHLVVEYEQLSIAWEGERVARKANRIFDKAHAIASRLRASEDGRKAFESLLDHHNRGVRLKAASECLAWGSEAALVTLEALVDPPGPYSLDAEMSLREYRAGRMRFDW